MEKNIKKFDSQLYKGTHEYYARYRPNIPERVINIIVKHFNIKPSDRILDIGCGTGQVALAMDGKCGEMVCLDPDPEMLKWAKKLTKNCKTKLTWLNYRAEDLGKIKAKLGTFKLATICGAFHWMDQKQVLDDLNELIEEDGGLAVFGDGVLWGGGEEWQQALKRVIQKYLRGKSHVGKERPIEPDELWENIIARSVFRFVKTHDVPAKRTWNVESVIGYIFSTAAAAPSLFGDQLDRFKEETKNILLSINPKGIFVENAVWSIVLGSKKPRD